MVRLPEDELETFVSALFERLGAPADVAADVTRSLIEADLSGHHSHGVRLARPYADRIANGEIDPTARPEVIRQDDTTVIIDGQAAFGQVVGRKAMSVTMPKAHESHIAIAGIRNATHLGRIGEWAERAAADDLAFVACTCNPGSTHVAPPGSPEGRLSTNPVTVGLPSFGAMEYPLVLDMATSQVAFGKIREQMSADKPVPDSWAAPYEGEPDPEPMLVGGPGSLLPLGGQDSGYKGFGLAAMAELLAGVISDGWVSGQPDAFSGNEAMFILVDPLHFTTEEAIRDRISHFREYVLSAERSEEMDIGIAAYGDELLLPGESEHQQRGEQRRNGISIRKGDYELLRTLAAQQDVDSDVPDPVDSSDEDVTSA